MSEQDARHAAAVAALIKHGRTEDEAEAAIVAFERKVGIKR